MVDMEYRYHVVTHQLVASPDSCYEWLPTRYARVRAYVVHPVPSPTWGD